MSNISHQVQRAVGNMHFTFAQIALLMYSVRKEHVLLIQSSFHHNALSSSLVQAFLIYPSRYPSFLMQCVILRITQTLKTPHQVPRSCQLRIFHQARGCFSLTPAPGPSSIFLARISKASIIIPAIFGATAWLSTAYAGFAN